MNRFYRKLAVSGFIFWILETAYFGFNETPINVFERFADIASQTAILWGILGDIFSNLTIVKHTHSHIKTKSFNINGKPIIKIK